jgi:hypothetical protein
MPVIITKDGTDYYLVPSPLFSFTRNTYNNVGRNGFGADYNITLEGTLVPNLGNPFYDMTAGSSNAQLSTDAWTKPSTAGSSSSDEPNYGYDADELLAATLRKQEKIRSLFSNDVISGVSQPIMVNITNWGETGSGLRFAAFVDSIDFGSEGRGVNPDSYTISMRTSNFINSANNDFNNNKNEYQPDYQVTDVSESFDIAEYETVNVSFSGVGINTVFDNQTKFYLVQKSISVNGAPVYDSDGSYVSGLAPWEQASGYVYTHLNFGTGSLPDFKLDTPFGLSGYQAADRVISESVDKEAGTYGVTESFILYSGDPVIHSISIDTEVETSERNTVTVEGTIQGLNTSDPFLNNKNNYLNASGFNAKINQSFHDGISNTGYVIPSAYFYAKTITELDWLNPIPINKSLGRDLNAGTITYSYGFNDRPPNLVSGSLIETISVNDTYPGELFSATPVIGRNQPVLQYLNSRSEYKRNLSINVTMGRPTDNWTYSDAPSGYWSAATQGNIQKWFINDKPSNISAASGDLAAIFNAINPVNDPNFSVRGGRCFHSAPQESWDAYSRTYTYSVEWTYEREV